MENQLNINVAQEIKPPVWTTPMLFYAMDWWQRNGNFNKDLYEKLVEIKYQIEIK